MIKNKSLAMAALMLFGAATPFAFAHVVLDQTEARAGSFQKLTFNLVHGCDESPTTIVRVLVPEGVYVARAQPKPGWTVALKQVKLPKPVATGHGADTDVIVREIAWTGGRLAAEQFDEFRLIVKLPNTPGTTLAIPVLQECERGELRWTEVPRAGQPAHDLQHPAPTLKLLPAAGHAHH